MIIDSESLITVSPSAIVKDEARPSVTLGVKSAIKLLATPTFTKEVPGFETAREAAWQLYNEMSVKDSVVRGCKGCQGRRLLRKFTGVYRLFVKNIRALAEEDGLTPLKQYCNTEQIIVKNPDTGVVYRY